MRLHNHYFQQEKFPKKGFDTKIAANGQDTVEAGLECSVAILSFVSVQSSSVCFDLKRAV